MVTTRNNYRNVPLTIGTNHQLELATVITNKCLFASDVIIHGAGCRIAAADVFSFSVDDRPNVFNPNDIYRKVCWVTVYDTVHTRNLLLCVFVSHDLIPKFVKLDSIH